MISNQKSRLGIGTKVTLFTILLPFHTLSWIRFSDHEFILIKKIFSAIIMNDMQSIRAPLRSIEITEKRQTMFIGI